MKILRITTLLDFGGQEKKYISFTENSKLLNNQYVFSAIGYGGNAEKILRERGFDVYILNRNFSIRNLSNIWAVYKLIKKIKPDVVHTAAAEANFHGIIAAKMAGVKYIIGEEIGIPNHSNIARIVFRLVYLLSNKVICVSQSVKNYLIKTKEITEKKGVVLYNPVSMPTKFDGLKSKKFNLTYIGRLEKEKNVETLILAFSNLDRRYFELTIVGDGREKENLQNLVKELKIKDSVKFEGFQTDIGKYLNKANLYILPSYTEGFGIAVVEAMFLKVPVLATKNGGIPEFIQNGVNGWLFDPNSVDELSNAINEIYSLPIDTILDIGLKGYDSVINRFTILNYVQKLESIYSQKL